MPRLKDEWSLKETVKALAANKTPIVEICRVTGLHRSTVSRWVHEQEKVKAGSKGEWDYQREYEAWKEKRQVQRDYPISCGGLPREPQSIEEFLKWYWRRMKRGPDRDMLSNEPLGG